jgi:hypothetical protein
MKLRIHTFRTLSAFGAFSLALLLLPAGPALARQEAAAGLNEEFKYQWQLRNFVGAIAGMFLPNHGEGSLTFKTGRDGHLKSELLITSAESKAGEYFRYGSEVDTRTLQPIRAWSAYSWRGEAKSKNESIDQEGVLDIAAGIYAIRQDPPTRSRRMEIWSEGKVYPVVVIPKGDDRRKLHGKMIPVRHYEVRGISLPGRRKWKGKMELWLAKDEAATPVEIVISRAMADVHMRLQSAS